MDIVRNIRRLRFTSWYLVVVLLLVVGSRLTDNYYYPPSQQSYYPPPPPPPMPCMQQPCYQLPAAANVAFMLSRASKHPTVNGYLSFDNMVTNLNASLYPAYGAFVCTLPGIYMFSISAATKDNEQFMISLRRNTQNIATLYGSPKLEEMASQTAIVFLNFNDAVYPYLELGDIFESTNVERIYTTFTGFLIAPSRGEIPAGTFGSNLPTGVNRMDEFPWSHQRKS